MIEYDKALGMSSYPSLTNKEIAQVLDKAYLALIAQKLTGNNQRGIAFEGDTKAIEDIRPLLTKQAFSRDDTVRKEASNEIVYVIPNNMMYYVKGWINFSTYNDAIDNKDHSDSPVLLISHADADKFKSTSYNLPWIKIPVCYIEGNNIHVFVDPFKYDDEDLIGFIGNFIQKPKMFSDDVDVQLSDVKFELSDSMAEELINLAIIMSSEIVQSPRLETKASIKPLES